MCTKKIIVLLLLEFLIEEVLVEKTHDDSLVSTTQRVTSDVHRRLTDQIKEAEEKLELYMKLMELELQKMQAEITNSLNSATNHVESILDESLEERIELIKAEFDLKLNRLELQTEKKVPRNCKEVQKTGGKTNIYFIKPKPEAEAFQVLCDMETRGGGWTYVLNRFSGSQNFDLKWIDYKRGFGNSTGEFWLGLDYLHYLTESEINELLIELVDWDGKTIYGHYNDFTIGNENSGYYLKILSRYSGDTTDAFGQHVGQKFSTSDRDNKHRCANFFHGGWWYGDRCSACLSGPYKKRGGENKNGITLNSHSPTYTKQARMMIRPRDESITFSLPHKN